MKTMELPLSKPVQAGNPVLVGGMITAFTALLAYIALPAIRFWYWEWTKPETYYGHAVFVPFIIAAIIWVKRKEITAAGITPNLTAGVGVAAGLAILVFAAKIQTEALLSLGLLMTLSFAAWTVLGTRAIKGPLLFPLIFAWLMAPLPGPLLNDATQGLQRFSTVGATTLLKLTMFHPRQDGNLIHMDNYTLNVDVPCSGFKLLLTLLTFSSTFSYLTDGPAWRRWVIFLVSLPLSILVNSIRIMMIGVSGEIAGASVAHAFHDWSGLISLVLCAVLLFSFAKAMKCKTFAGLPLF